VLEQAGRRQMRRKKKEGGRRKWNLVFMLLVELVFGK
jgi:hypothetical protein